MRKRQTQLDRYDEMAQERWGEEATIMVLRRQGQALANRVPEMKIDCNTNGVEEIEEALSGLGGVNINPLV